MSHPNLANLLYVWQNDYSQMVEDVWGVYKHSTWVTEFDSNPAIPHQEKWQEEAFHDFHNHNRLAIKSGKGVGKSAFAAWLILCALGTNSEIKIPCTAPSSGQLFDVLWAECAKWAGKIKPEFKQLLPYDVKSDRITLSGMNYEAFATAKTARKDQPEALQGIHGKMVLAIVDEASGVDDKVFEAGEGTMSTTGAKTLLIGNPTRTDGYFYECWHKDSQRWKVRTVSCYDSGRVTQDYIDGMRLKWGETSNEYQVGVLGNFPSGNTQSIIGRAIIEEAYDNPPEDPNPYPLVWGLDIARFGIDRTALASRKGFVMPHPPRWWSGKDLEQTSMLVADMYFMAKPDDRPVDIVVDIIGLGAGVYDRLHHLGLPVTPCTVSRQRNIAPGYRYLRDELWFRARSWFESRRASFPLDRNSEDMRTLVTELSSVEYDIDPSGKKHVLDKHTSKVSPDLADAFILTFGSAKARWDVQNVMTMDPVQKAFYENHGQKRNQVVCSAQYLDYYQ